MNKRITSGETERVEKESKDWYQLFDEDSINEREDLQRWEYDDVVKCPTKFFDKIGEFKFQPRYKYVICYLLSICGEKNKKIKEIYKELEQGIRIKDDMLTAALSEKVRQKFEENGFFTWLENYDNEIFHKWLKKNGLESKWEKAVQGNNMEDKTEIETAYWRQYFSRLLEFKRGENESKLLEELAFGTKMSIEDYTFFTKKVLFKSVNYYDKARVFHYIVLEFAGEKNYFECYENLKKIYSDVEIMKETEVPEKSGYTQLITGTVKEIIKEVSEKNGNSDWIFKKKEEQLLLFLGENLYLSESIRSAEYKKRAKKKEIGNTVKGAKRTSGRKIEYLISEISRLFQKNEDSNEEAAVFRDNKLRKMLEEYNAQHRITVNIGYYDDFILKKGTKFWTNIIVQEQNRKKIVPVYFKTNKDYEFTTRYVEQKLKVRSVTDEKMYPLIRDALIHTGKIERRRAPKMVKEEYIRNGKINIMLGANQNADKIKEIHLGGAIRFTTEGDNGTGYFKIVCSPDVEIPVGTKVSFDIADQEGKVYTCSYETTESINKLKTLKMRVIPMESNPEPLSDPIKGGQELVADAQVEGIHKIYVFRNGSLHYCPGDKHDNYVCVECDRRYCIPQGTILSFESKGNIYHYRVDKTYESEGIKCEQSIEIECTNLTEIMNKIQDGDKKNIRVFNIFEKNQKLYCCDEKIADVTAVNAMKVFPNEEYIEASVQNEIPEFEQNYSLLLKHMRGDDEVDIQDKEIKKYAEKYEDYKIHLMNYDKNYLLNLNNFNHSLMQKDKDKKYEDEELIRNMILTYFLIIYSKKYLNDEEIGLWELDLDELQADFSIEVNKIMNKCGFLEFNTGYPYDSFILLLLACDQPYELYKALYSRSHPLIHCFFIRNKNGNDVKGETFQLLIKNKDSGLWEELYSWKTKEKQNVYMFPKLYQDKNYKIIRFKTKEECEIVISGENDNETIIEIIEGEMHINANE
ncbi:MAG: hypothetical protein ACLRZ9_02735 [Eubacterium sp.]